MTQPAARPEFEPGGAHYEAGLLARMASAPSQQEQLRLCAELETFRRERSARLREATALDLAQSGLERLRPTAATEPWSRTTQDTDWMTEVEPDAHDLGEVTQAMVARASAWYSRELHPAVKAHPGEVLAQAQGAAGVAAGGYGTAYPAAHRAFVDHVAHLVGRTAEQVPPSSTLPAGVANGDTFDQPMWDDFSGRPKADGTRPSDTPSLGEGSAPAGDVDQGLDNPVNDATHDAGPGGLVDSVDYLDGHRTAPTNGSGMTSMSGRAPARTAAGGLPPAPAADPAPMADPSASRNPSASGLPGPVRSGRWNCALNISSIC